MRGSQSCRRCHGEFRDRAAHAAARAALRRAQRDIDLRPELYTKYYRNEFPERFHDVIDTRRWGPGERLVFEPYTRDVFEQAFNWIAEREIFPPDQMGAGVYATAELSLAQG